MNTTWLLNNTTDTLHNCVPFNVPLTLAPLGLAIIIVILAIISHNRGGDKMT